VKTDKLTIVHISDLHRSKEHPISNISLLDSLLQDMDKYVGKGKFDTPNILIVSGDIVHGSRDTVKASEIIESQYEEALSFLNDLTNKMFDGDKSRVIIIPGNHDVSWTESNESMTIIDDGSDVDDAGRIRKQLFKDAIKIDSNIKWSWADRSFYKISNEEKYNERMKYFAKFYKDFYGDKEYSLDPTEQFEVFDFPAEGVTILGFNSCYHNDHLNRAGSINPNCIAKSGIRTRNLKRQGRLFLATWHHNFRGGPYDQDYMDDTVLESLISKEVKIGFHGHQHKQQIVRIQNTVVEDKKMYVFSAGSLCAGPAEIPTGYNRQYNLIELRRIDTSKLSVRVISRQKTAESSFDNPVWETGPLDSSLETIFEREFNHDQPEPLKLYVIERMVSDGDFTEAINELKLQDQDEPLVRKMLLECYSKTNDEERILKDFFDPVTDEEAIQVMNACISVGSQQQKHNLYNSEYIQESADPSVVIIRDQLKAVLK
jgi:3',5'-cyclic AMP phosphodiesterase CpdA